MGNTSSMLTQYDIEEVQQHCNNASGDRVAIPKIFPVGSKRRRFRLRRGVPIRA
ncbi:hypothetical protein CRYUN_Cryun02cG0098000 [Craigia yunnanensis]